MATVRGFTIRSFLLVLILAGAGFYYAKDRGYLNRWLAPALLVDPSTLTSELSESQMRSRFPELKFKCYSENSGLGDQTCWSDISAYNGIKASTAAFFLNRGKLSNVRIGYDPAAYDAVSGQLRAKYGESRQMGSDQSGNPITAWNVSSGIVGISKTVNDKNEMILVWMSREALLAQMSRR